MKSMVCVEGISSVLFTRTKGTFHLRLGHVTQRVSQGEAVITLVASDDATAFSGAVTTPA